MNPLCFVLMPFGRKPAGSGLTVDFDAVYADLIAPAIEAAGLEPLRADQELTGGIIHKPMFERLILCDFAVADHTAANADVFRDRVKYRDKVKARLAAARKQGVDAVRAVEASLGSVSDQEAAVREKWEPETSARDLRLIRAARERRGEDAAWVLEAEAVLQRRAQKE